MTLSFTIRLSNGSRFDVTLTESSTTLESTTVRQIKEAIQADHADLTVEQQRLIYKGKILDNDRVLSDYGIVHQATLHLVMARNTAATPGTPAAGTTVQNNTPSTTATSTAPSLHNINHNAAGATAPPAMIPPFNPLTSPFAAAAGANNNNNSSNNNMLWQQLQQQQQQQMLQDPEMMQQMLNSPLMQNLLDNPQVFQNMMEMNPQVRQLMDQNPELRQLFQDPQLMRQSMDLMRNPTHMQYLMRQQDLAMSQLENLPGGFSALSNMYHNVQEPMMQAMVEGNQNNPGMTASGGGTPSAATTTAATTSATAGATGQAMPNPWGSPLSNRPIQPPRAMTSNLNQPSSNMPSTTASSAMMPPLGTATGAAAASPWNFPPMAMPPTLGLGGGGGAPTPEQMEQTLQMLEQNPMMQQAMDQLFSNPQMVQTLLGNNPAMQQLRRENPMAFDMMMQNPQMLRTMLNPQHLRMMMQMQQAMQGGGGGGGASTAAPPMSSSSPLMMMNPWGLSATGGYNPSASSGSAGSGGSATPPLDFSNLLSQYQAFGLGNAAAATGGGGFGGLGISGAGFGVPPQPTTTSALPADRFRHQLQSLYDMGFDDEQANLAALQLHHGNLNRAIDALLTGTVPMTTAPTTTTTTAASTTTTTTTTTAEAVASQEGDVTVSSDTSNNDDVPPSSENNVKKDATEKKND
jgi:ubiquilin